MGWAHVQDTPGGGLMSASLSQGLAQSAGTFASPNLPGNCVIVLVTGYANSLSLAAGDVTCTDNASTPNTYSQLFWATDGALDWVAAFLAPITSLPAAGNLNPQVSIGEGFISYLTLCAAEFSGGSLQTDGPAVIGAAVNTTSLTLRISTAVAGDLLIAVANPDANNDAATITSPVAFSVIGKLGDSHNTEAGDGDYKIVAGTVNNLAIQWQYSVPASNGWAAGVVALKPAAPARQLTARWGPMPGRIFTGR